jgi:D-beta-D-heptose 7-phosphate kinase/D-beta-D-heptose 1-phosphate adenosyltransferase
MIKIFVIGEKCIDTFVYGEVNRLSPEAPIPVFLPKNTVINDGMAANVVRNLKSISYDDVEIQYCHQQNMIYKTRYVEKKSNYPFIRIDENEEHVERVELNDELLSKIINSDAVIVSDYDKGFLTETDIQTIAEVSKFCILDSKKKLKRETILFFDFVKLNESEFNLNYTEDDELLEKIIVTLGSKGSKHKGISYPSDNPQETVDVSGAGDTFVAAFTKKYIDTKDVSIAITFANKMAAKVVSKRGVNTM